MLEKRRQLACIGPMAAFEAQPHFTVFAARYEVDVFHGSSAYRQLGPKKVLIVSHVSHVIWEDL